MAAKGPFPIKVESNLHGFIHVLKSAVCEWLLLFFLLLDAAFSYFLTKFAQYCELQVPCILCSRLDHIIGKEKPNFYRNLLCSNHKLEVSSLVSCCNHGKLVDVHEMCEECVLSFAKNESSEELYRILVGKLGSDCLQKPLLNLDSGCGSLTTKFCSCCSKPWRSRPNVQKLVQSKPSPPPSKPDIPLPTSRYLNRQDGLKNRKNRFSLSNTPLVLGSTDYDSLSHVGYTEVKISSDSDSDFPFSDDDDSIIVSRNPSPQGCIFIPKSPYEDVYPAVKFPPPVTNNLVFPHLEPEKGETTTPRFPIPNGDAKQGGLGEINLQQVVEKASPAVSEFVSLDDIPLSSSTADNPPPISADEGDRISLAKKFGASDYSDPISHKSTLPSNNIQLPAKLSRAKNIETIKPREYGVPGHFTVFNNWESIDLSSTSIDSTRRQAASLPNISSLVAARDLAFNAINEAKASSRISEQFGERACNGVGSDEEPVASKVSDSQIELPSSNMTTSSVNGHTDEQKKTEITTSMDSQMPLNSTVNGHTDEQQKTEITTSIGSQMPLNSIVNGHTDEQQKTEIITTSIDSQIPTPVNSPNMERSRSLESLEGNVSDLESESLVDKLERQVEYDKKQIDELQKELDEERNAAAIAANQAMAMITKLQEEKAALNMEALQYLRMMEEQAEYDVDALEKANDMIAEKEKVIQDLEAELDYFRLKYPDEFPEMNEELLFAEEEEGPYVEGVDIETS